MIDLKPFCSTNHRRPHLSRPFAQGEYTYATNGRILVRVRRLPDTEEQNFINIGKAIDDAGSKPEFFQLRIKLPPATVAACSFCDGRGVEHYCPDCDHDCDYCGGTGRTEREFSVAIRGAIFNVRDIRMIQSLPNARLAVAPHVYSPTWFEFDGGDGLLTAMGYPFNEHIADPEEEPAK